MSFVLLLLLLLLAIMVGAAANVVAACTKIGGCVTEELLSVARDMAIDGFRRYSTLRPRFSRIELILARLARLSLTSSSAVFATTIPPGSSIIKKIRENTNKYQLVCLKK